MVGMNFSGRSQGYRQNGGGKLMPLALAGLAAAAWYNRDKLTTAFNDLKNQNAGAGGSGSAGGLLGGLLNSLRTAAGGAAGSAGNGVMGSTAGGATRADGSDDSASFGAGIADEGSIPRSTGSAY